VGPIRSICPLQPSGKQGKRECSPVALPSLLRTYHNLFEERLIRGPLLPIQQSGAGENPRPGAYSQDVLGTGCLFLEEIHQRRIDRVRPSVYTCRRRTKKIRL